MRPAARYTKAPRQPSSCPPEPPPADPVAAAEAARLRYVSDLDPGIRRVRSGKGFRYVGPDRKPVRDPEALKRIRSLVLPPAWQEVWICTRADGHLQATGRDARGRKQYRYHPRWRAVRDETKYERVLAFARALPGLRARVEADLSRAGLPRAKVLAAVVRLLEVTLIRVGNEEYARSNHSYGLTTLRDHHAAFRGAKVSFHFRGKSGVRHSVTVTDRRLAGLVRRCQELPGQELFQYVAEDGSHHPVGSGDVNDYLREATGRPFTAKDFRTWAGTVLAARALQAFAEFDSKAQAKRNIVQAITEVARRLGNTRTVCQKCYVHPAVLDAYLDGSLLRTLERRAERELRRALPDLPPEEAAVLALLQQRLRAEADARGTAEKPRQAKKPRASA
jgi:DNA topoisomerase I